MPRLPRQRPIMVLQDAGILHETTGMQRDRAFTYRRYVKALAE